MIFIVIPYFLDQVNGFVNLVLNTDFPISKVYKTPILLYAIIYTLMYDRSRRYSFMLLIFLLVMMVSLIINANVFYLTAGDLSVDFGYQLKIFSLPIQYFFFVVFHKKNPFPDEAFVKKLFLFLFFAFSIAIFLSYFGLGIPFYGTTDEGESIGQRGYFISGNEISGMYLLFTSMFYFYVFRSQSIIYMFVGLGICMGVGMLIGSKTAIGSSLVCFLGNYVLQKKYYKKMLTISKLDAGLILTFTLFILVGIIFINQIFDVMQPIIGHFKYRYKTSGEDLLRFLTSGRLDRAVAVLDNYAYNFSFVHKLIGQGYSTTKLFHIPNWRYPNCEMDIIDIMCISGLIGMSMIYGFWSYVCLRVYLIYQNRKSELAIPVGLGLGILIINSIITGHVIYSGVVTPSMAYLTAYILSKKKDPVVYKNPEELLEKPAYIS